MPTTTAWQNVYVRDRQTNTTILVSRADGPAGAGANAGSIQPAISPDGRYVAFSSTATTWCPAPTTADVRHIYLRDIADGVTTIVDRADGPFGSLANQGSADPALTVVGGVPPWWRGLSNAPTNLDGATRTHAPQIYVRYQENNDTQMVSRRDAALPPNANEPATATSSQPLDLHRRDAPSPRSTRPTSSPTPTTNNGRGRLRPRRRERLDRVDRQPQRAGGRETGASHGPVDQRRRQPGVASPPRATNLVLIGDSGLRPATSTSATWSTDAPTWPAAPTGSDRGQGATTLRQEPALIQRRRLRPSSSPPTAGNPFTGDTNGRRGRVRPRRPAAPRPNGVSRPATGVEANAVSVHPSSIRGADPPGSGVAPGGVHLTARHEHGRR